MALVPSFTASPQVGNPSVIILTDTSTGSDSNVTVRHVYLRKSDGNFLVPTGTTTDYIVWPYTDQTITIDVLEKDRALWITVQWETGGTPFIFDDTFDITFD